MLDRSRIAALLSTRYCARGAWLSPLQESDDAAAYRVSMHGGDPWVLRVFPPSRPRERVAGDARILAFLGRRRFPAERLIPAADGSPCCDLDGHGVIVTRFIPGRPAGSTPDELRRLGSLLGRLVTLERLPTEGRRPAGSLPREDLDYGRRCLAELDGHLPDRSLAELNALRRMIDATGDCTDLPHALIHPDCGPDNAIRRPDGRIELIDWTGAGVGPRIAALGVLLSGAVLDIADQAGGGDDLDGVDAVMDGFCRHVRLEPDEIACLADAIRYRPLVLAAREFSCGVRADGLPRYDLAEVIADRAETAIRRGRSRQSRPHVNQMNQPSRAG